jgi:hypothetical protein
MDLAVLDKDCKKRLKSAQLLVLSLHFVISAQLKLIFDRLQVGTQVFTAAEYCFNTCFKYFPV